MSFFYRPFLLLTLALCIGFSSLGKASPTGSESFYSDESDDNASTPLLHHLSKNNEGKRKVSQALIFQKLPRDILFKALPWALDDRTCIHFMHCSTKCRDAAIEVLFMRRWTRLPDSFFPIKDALMKQWEKASLPEERFKLLSRITDIYVPFRKRMPVSYIGYAMNVLGLNEFYLSDSLSAKGSPSSEDEEVRLQNLKEIIILRKTATLPTLFPKKFGNLEKKGLILRYSTSFFDMHNLIKTNYPIFMAAHLLSKEQIREFKKLSEIGAGNSFEKEYVIFAASTQKLPWGEEEKKEIKSVTKGLNIASIKFSPQYSPPPTHLGGFREPYGCCGPEGCFGEEGFCGDIRCLCCGSFDCIDYHYEHFCGSCLIQ